MALTYFMVQFEGINSPSEVSGSKPTRNGEHNQVGIKKEDCYLFNRDGQAQINRPVCQHDRDYNNS